MTMISETRAAALSSAPDQGDGLHRAIDWKGAFWIASGVPALVMISIGGMGAAAGKLAFVVWTISVLMGFLQAYSYAEIAGLFANKSGGAAVYGAAAWLRYSKLIAPLSVWCNWYAWTPVLSLGCTIAACRCGVTGMRGHRFFRSGVRSRLVIF